MIKAALFQRPHKFMYKNRNCPIHSHEEGVTVDWPTTCHQERDLVHCTPSPTKWNLRNPVSWLCSWTVVCWEPHRVPLSVLAGFLMPECSSQAHSVYSRVLSRSVMSDCDPWTVACQASLTMQFSRQEYWVGCHFPLQGLSLTQRANPSLLHILHWQVDFYHCATCATLVFTQKSLFSSATVSLDGIF